MSSVPKKADKLVNLSLSLSVLVGIIDVAVGNVGTYWEPFDILRCFQLSRCVG